MIDKEISELEAWRQWARDFRGLTMSAFNDKDLRREVELECEQRVKSGRREERRELKSMLNKIMQDT